MIYQLNDSKYIAINRLHWIIDQNLREIQDFQSLLWKMPFKTSLALSDSSVVCGWTARIIDFFFGSSSLSRSSTELLEPVPEPDCPFRFFAGFQNPFDRFASLRFRLQNPFARFGSLQFRFQNLIARSISLRFRFLNPKAGTGCRTPLISIPVSVFGFGSQPWF